MSASSFFGSLLAQFVQDLMFRRPITVEVKRDANGFNMKASINPSGATPVVYQPYPYPPAPPPPYYPYGYPYAGGPPTAPQPPAPAPPPPPQAAANRARPFVLPEEFRR